MYNVYTFLHSTIYNKSEWTESPDLFITIFIPLSVYLLAAGLCFAFWMDKSCGVAASKKKKRKENQSRTNCHGVVPTTKQPLRVSVTSRPWNGSKWLIHRHASHHLSDHFVCISPTSNVVVGLAVSDFVRWSIWHFSKSALFASGLNVPLYIHIYILYI